MPKKTSELLRKGRRITATELREHWGETDDEFKEAAIHLVEEGKIICTMMDGEAYFHLAGTKGLTN